jgi:toluene monooxygenase system protein E
MTQRGLKTYSRLQGERKRIPSVYEIVSSDLLWYRTQGIAVRSPIEAWYARHRTDSALQLLDPDAFADPAATTYRAYVDRQRDAVGFDEALFRRAHAHPDLDAAWIEQLRVGFAPLRYPYHALGMIAAYIGSMAPGGRIAIAAAFQAADETRRVHAFAQRLALLRRTRPGFGDDARAIWEHDARWQPLRRVIERALTTWDWGEAFAVLALALKPTLDEIVHVDLARAARRHDDPVLAELLASLHEDSAWERDWTRALVHTAIAQREDNKAVLQRWITAWRPQVNEAAIALAPVLGAEPDRSNAAHDAFLRSCGLEGGM